MILGKTNHETPTNLVGVFYIYIFFGLSVQRIAESFLIYVFQMRFFAHFPNSFFSGQSPINAYN